MALPYETPARVWRRIEEGEEHGEEMPSLPSFPGFEDSVSEKSSISLSSSTSRVLEEPEVCACIFTISLLFNYSNSRQKHNSNFVMSLHENIHNRNGTGLPLYP